MLAGQPPHGVGAAVVQFDARERPVVMDGVHHQLVSSSVFVVPDVAGVQGELVAARSDAGELCRDCGPTTFRANCTV
jgi:hypothetical protein